MRIRFLLVPHSSDGCKEVVNGDLVQYELLYPGSHEVEELPFRHAGSEVSGPDTFHFEPRDRFPTPWYAKMLCIRLR